MTWTTATLDDLCEIRVGRTPARANPEFWGEGMPWLSIADMNQGRTITHTKEQITAAGAIGGHQVTPGTVLLSFKLSIGKVAKAGVSLFTNEAIAALPIKRPDLIFDDYLVRALEFTDLCGRSNRAAMGATLNKAKLREVPIPLPPLATQRRISAILDHADALRTKRRQVLALLDSLISSTYQSMFDALESVPLAEIGSLGIVVTGKTPPTAKEGLFDGPIPFVTPGDLTSNMPVARSVTPEGARASRVVRPGATLVCCIGATIGKVGQAAVRSAFNQQINAIEWGDLIDDSYGLVALKRLKPTIVARGASTTLPLLPKRQFEKLRIPVPPLSLQLEFAARSSSIRQKWLLESRAMAFDDELFASLQARAFRGEL